MPAPTPEELLEVVRRVLAKEFELAPEAITPEAHLIHDLDLDSIDAVIVALRLEAETGLEFGEEEFKALDTVASLVTLVQQRHSEPPGSAS
jgi:acyl carrier protein